MNEKIVVGDVDYEELLARSRKQMFQIQALSARLARINDLAAAISSTVDVDIILRLVAEQTQDLLTFDHGSVTLKTDAKWMLWTLSGEEDLSQVIDPEDDFSLGYTIRTGNPRLVLNKRGMGIFSMFASYLIVPLQGETSVIGTLNFVARNPQAFGIEDLHIARLIAFQLANALRNAERFHELRRTQDQLRRHGEELEARNQELDAYNQIIAHDLKAPLNAIYGYASLLSLFSGEEFDQLGAVYIKQIIDSAQGMNSMIEQLLWLANAQNAPVVLVNTAAVLNRVSLRLEHMFVARGIRLEIDPNLPPAMGQAVWVEEIFANLVNNAIKYMSDDPDPYVRVRGQCEGAFCRYEVQDNGIGIDQDHLKNVFQMFARFNPGEVEGHGLGLSIVSRLVRRLNGSVGVESTPGVGSLFWFTLPTPEDA